MQQHKLTAILLSGILTIPFFSSAAAAAEEETQPGLHLAKFDDAALQMQALENAPAFFTVSDGVSAFASNEPLPDTFDLRTKGLVSSVKEQDPYGTCWAFSAVNSVETSLIARKADIDLSEWHLAYYTYCGTFGYPTSQEDLFDEGSYDIRQEVGMLTSWAGPVNEEDAPYGDDAIRDSQKTMEDLQAEAAYHVTNAKTYPIWALDDELRNAQIEGMKRAIYSGLALDARYTDNEDCYDDEHHTYYYDYEICDNDLSGGHSISIVGWDDNVPASYFRSDPGRDGAWLVKNSWGSNWGNYGYFWISYNDTTLCDAVAFEAEPAEPDMRLYQYDSYGNHSSFASEEDGDYTVLAANVFTAEQDGFIDSVMLCNMINDDAWEITVYTGLTDPADPTSGTSSDVTGVVLPELGYQTIDLVKAVPIKAGEQFSIVANISGEERSHHIPCEYACHSEWYNPDGSLDASDGIFTLEMLERDFHEGESFYSTDGTEWHDVYLNGSQVTEYHDEETNTFSTYTERIGNICLKAVTKDAGAVTFSDYHETLPVGTPITLSSTDGAQIYYSVNGGAYTPYTEPVIFEDAMTISAYADTGERVIYTQHYEEETAAISSILCIEDDFCWYADADEEPNTFHYYIPSGLTSIGLLPISTGTVTIGDTVLPSGVVTQVEIPGRTTKLQINVAQDGLTPAAYTLILEDMGDDGNEKGDVNLDGRVNASDAAEILIYAALAGAGNPPDLPDEKWITRGDYNGNGTVDASDAAAVLIYAAEAGANGSHDTPNNNTAPYTYGTVLTEKPEGSLIDWERVIVHTNLDNGSYGLFGMADREVLQMVVDYIECNGYPTTETSYYYVYVGN